MKNVYFKYDTNVFIAQCFEEHEKGDVIGVTNRHGNVNQHIVHNFIGYLTIKENTFYMYSITRLDGLNVKTRSIKKRDKCLEYANNAKKRSSEYLEASEEGKDFLALAEPIKQGHHSQRRHENLLEKKYNRIGKSVEEDNNAKRHEEKAKDWDRKSLEINLSMPESIEYFKKLYDEALEYHQYLKDNPAERRTPMSLNKANKNKKKMKDRWETAITLWR